MITANFQQLSLFKLSVMIYDIEVNNRKIKAYRGETILSALQRNGIIVPTLCFMKDLSPTGACRMCVVEVEGEKNLVTACSHTVEEWMKIYTHSLKVINTRKLIIEMLLASHPDECLYCIRNTNCELQKYTAELNVSERRFNNFSERKKNDVSGAGISYEPSKCILCGRCVRVCDEIQGVNTIDFIKRGISTIINPSFSKSISNSNCIYCGQCVRVCPTAALTGKNHIPYVLKNVHKQNTKLVAQCSPAVAISIAEEFGVKAGKDFSGQMVTALKKCGFDAVFDTSVSIDLHIYETAKIIVEKIKNNDKTTLFSSSCPAWVKYAEQSDFDLSRLSIIKSPQQIMATLIKTLYAQNVNIKPENIFSVSISPCLAKKYEAQREEHNQNIYNEVDAVLLVRELARLIKLSGIDFLKCEPAPFDEPFNIRSSASNLYAVSGGEAESILRTVIFMLTGKETKDNTYTKLRGFKDIKEISVKAGIYDINFAVVNGIKNIHKLLDEIKTCKRHYDFVEIMSCSGGCINGGGQPLKTSVEDLKLRTKIIYENDKKDVINKAHKSPFVNDFYNDTLNRLQLVTSFDELFKTSYKYKKVLN